MQITPDRGPRKHEALRRTGSIPCETIPPIAFLLLRSTGLAPGGCQHMVFLQFSATQLTLYWLSTRSTVVSLGSNLKTCFRSAGPSTASSRAQSISSGSRTSRRPAGCSMVQGAPGWGLWGRSTEWRGTWGGSQITATNSEVPHVTQQGAQQLSPSHTYAAALMHAVFRIIDGRLAASKSPAVCHLASLQSIGWVFARFARDATHSPDLLVRSGAAF